ncbi:MAG: UMP kinase [Dehalococcoidia bacterium]
MAAAVYSRVLLKLSGEALMGPHPFGIDSSTLRLIADQIRNAMDTGTQLAVVVGGGNFWRGKAAAASYGMDQATADYAGMLGTIMNATALQDVLEKAGVTVRTQSAINVQQIAEPFILRRAVRHLEKGRVVIFAAGTGNPYMSTDTAAALRAIEIGAEAVLMAKNKVDGVYDADPSVTANARRFLRLRYIDALQRRLAVMDSTALSLCMDNGLPIIVFDLAAPNSIERAVRGESLGTIVGSADTILADEPARL